MQPVARRATLHGMVRSLVILLLAGLFAACASHTAPDTASSSAAPAPATTNALAGTPMAVYGHDLNKAKNVQNIVNDQAKKQDAAIEAATGSSSP
ncbi:MAG TPA: hypothetical protein VFY97_04510 [Rhodanobacteraceae bacterium]|nr:hypothetical protein [Rhodanobacteraceae bacterium]